MTRPARPSNSCVFARRVQLSLLFGSAVLAQACTDEDHRSRERIGDQQSALVPAEARRFSLSLPSDAGLDQVAVGAGAALMIRDRASIVTASGGFAGVSNAGRGVSDLGVESRVGNTTSAAALSIRDRARVTGSVRSDGAISVGTGVVISGAVQANTLTSFDLRSWSVQFPASDVNVMLSPDQTRALAPASYERINVHSRARLQLRAGIYYADELTLEPQSQLELDTRSGPIQIYVRRRLIFRGRSSFNGPNDRLLVGFAGTESPALDASMDGTLVAPNTSVRLGVGGSPYAGAVYASGVEVDPDVRFTHRVFGGWDAITFDVVPRFDCVERRSERNLAALFGYFNPNTRAVTVPIGQNNRFLPGLEDRGQPTTFLPGRHANSFAVTWVSFQPTWSLNATSAAVELARQCPANLTLANLADTSVDADLARANFGSASSLRVSSRQHTLVRFDRRLVREALGTGRLIRSARLELRVSGAAPSGSLEVLPMRSRWEEMGATWNCANDLDPAPGAERCRALDVWSMVRKDGTWANPWGRVTNPTPRLGSVQGDRVVFDVTEDLGRFMGPDLGLYPPGWIIQARSGSALLSSREAGPGLAPQLIVEPVSLTDFDRAAHPAFSVVVDGTVTPGVGSLPALADGQARPTAALVADTGVPSDFVANEILLQTDDPAQLAAVMARWNATNLSTESSPIPGLPSVHLLRVDPARAAPETLRANVEQMLMMPSGRQRVSSDMALRLLAIVMDEAARGSPVGLNWIARGQAISLDAVANESIVDGPQSSLDGTGTTSSNDYLWRHYLMHRVPQAWEVMLFSNRLTRSIDVGIVDAGYAGPDLDGSFTQFFCASGSCENPFDCGGGNDCPWHGTHVASAGFGEAGNQYGGSGPGSDVADVTLLWGFGDQLTITANLPGLVADGNEIVNYSNAIPTPDWLFAANLPGEATTTVSRRLGTLIFAAAGNDNTDIERRRCYEVREPISELIGGLFGGGGFTIVTVCPWEETWWFPCENGGVDCVSATNFADRNRAPYSNFGESVSYTATGTVLSSRDPNSAGIGNGFQSVNGTSFASPFVAGIAALTWAADPDGQGADSVEECLSLGPNKFVDALTSVRCGLPSIPDNFTPRVQILNPSDGAVFGGPGLFNLRAVAADLEDGRIELIGWNSDVDGPLGQSASGSQLTVSFSSPGRRRITATAFDSRGARGEHSITISIEPTPPHVRIVEPPNDGTRVVAGLPFELFARVDNRLVFPCEGFSWSAFHETTFLFDGRNGCSIEEPFHLQGTTRVRAFASDGFGQSFDERRLEVFSDGKLHAKITQPRRILQVDGSLSADVRFTGQPVLLSATAVPQGGQYTFTWRAGQLPDRTGGLPQLVEAPKTIGTGQEFLWQPSAALGNCGSKRFRIWVRVTDADGNVASDSVEVVLRAPCIPA